MTPRLSIIVPVLNEAAELPSLLEHLSAYAQRDCEIIFVDGGSTDQTVNQMQQAGYVVINADRGRARQMNAGAGRASGQIFLFLHADTRLPDYADQQIQQALSAGNRWGRFDVNIIGQSLLLPIIARLMNLRSRLTGIATGDQAIFLQRDLFERTGGFPDQPLMEDIELCARLRRITRPVCLEARVTTSGRRWESRGVWRTMLLMWTLRLAYFIGVPAEQLAKYYK